MFGRACAQFRALGPALVMIPLCGGCGGSPSGPVEKAGRVFVERSQSDPQVADWVLSVVREPSVPAIREFVLASIPSPRRETALLAMRAIGDPPPADAGAALRAAFEQRKGGVKLRAAVGLARLGDAEALAWVRESVSSGEGAMNLDAIKLLADQDGEALVRPVLERAMGSEDQSVRDEVYAILGEVRRPWATALLRAGLEREFGEQRVQAIAALGRTGDPAVAEELQRWVNTQGLVFAALEGLGALGNPGARPALEAMVRHDEPLVRGYAAVALWRVGQAEPAREALEPLLEDPDVEVRRRLAQQLEPIGEPQATAMLVRLVADADRTVGLAALRSLLGRTSREVEQAALELAAGKDYELRILALNVLARCGGPAAMAGLEPLLDDANPYVAVAAAEAILEISARAGAAPAS